MAGTPVLDFQLMGSNQSQKHVTFNNAMLELDILIQLAILDRDLSNPPGSPSPGDRYIVASGATGLWAGQEGKIAAWINSIWKFFDPLEGWIAWVLDESNLIQWDGSQWQQFTLAAGGGASTFGINTGADTTNRLAVASPASLFTHDGSPGGHLMSINKSAVAQNAGLVLQSGFSTRALFGLLGNNDLEFRVSHNGSAFTTALAIRHNSAGQGNVGIGTGADANNRLTVSGQSMLFTNSGDLRFTFNKGAPANDCALTFQSGFSARALVGLLGSDDFAFSVSPDGSNYNQAIFIDKDDGFVALPQHEKFIAFINFDQYTDTTFVKGGFNNTIYNDQSAYDAENNRFVAKKDGLYLFGLNFIWVRNEMNNPNRINAEIRVNGTAVPLRFEGRATPALDGEVIMSPITMLELDENDEVEVWWRCGTLDGFMGENSRFFGYRIT